ncbi:hypothetical protein Drorol1_Dr00002657 [Drosera rotundifolia]
MWLASVSRVLNSVLQMELFQTSCLAWTMGRSMVRNAILQIHICYKSISLVKKHVWDTPAGYGNLGEVVSRWSNLLTRSLGPPSNRTYAPCPNDNTASNVEPHEKFVMRRKRKKWTPLEEDTLVEGIKRFGEGNWKVIKLAYRDVFVDRTDVDIKDKWRNMNHWGRMKM